MTDRPETPPPGAPVTPHLRAVPNEGPPPEIKERTDDPAALVLYDVLLSVSDTIQTMADFLANIDWESLRKVVDTEVALVLTRKEQARCQAENGEQLVLPGMEELFPTCPACGVRVGAPGERCLMCLPVGEFPASWGWSVDQ